MISRRDMLLTGSAACITLAGCGAKPSKPGQAVESFAPRMSEIVSPDAVIEELANGFTWSEGPTWDRKRQALYFTDVPKNKAYRWTRSDGLTVFLDPSGAPEAIEGFREPGANGLWYNSDDTLLICNHGRRAIERMSLEDGSRQTLVQLFGGQRFHSPNDVVQASDGRIFFTDPPYGLEGINDSPLKEMSENGVYCLHADGSVTRIVDDMTLPNGVALSPDERFAYVTQSDSAEPILRRLTLSEDGQLERVETLFDFKSYMADGSPGLPDGLAVAQSGELFVTGPGGVFVLSPEGEVLGRILTGSATANCAFGEDGSTLFITAHDRLLKINTQARGVQWNS